MRTGALPAGHVNREAPAAGCKSAEALAERREKEAKARWCGQFRGHSLSLSPPFNLLHTFDR